MKTAPDYFKSGEALSAQKLNSVVAAVRGHRPYRATDWSGEARRFLPFDPISVDYDHEDEKWKLILQPSYIISGSSSQEIFFEEDPLSAFPEIDVEEDMHLFLDLSTSKLEWKEEGSSGLLVIRQIKPDEEEAEGEETRQFFNAHPSLVFDAAPAFHASVVRVGDEEKIAISPGYVISQNIGNDTPVKRYTPTLGGTAIDDNPEPINAAPYIYLYVETDEKGIVTGTPQVQGSASQQSGNHHEPNEAEAGEYYFLLAETATEDGRLKITKRYTGNVFIPNQLIEIVNVGGEREIWKAYDKGADRHELRTLEQLAGPGEAIMRPLDEEEEEGDTIEFRRIAQRQDASPQIHVEVEDDDIIIVKGNGVDASVSDSRKVSIEVRDGLVTSLTGFAPEDGINANLEIYLSSFDSEGKLSNPDHVHFGLLKWRDGLLVRAEWDGNTLGEDPDDSGLTIPGDLLVLRANRNFVPE